MSHFELTIDIRFLMRDDWRMRTTLDVEDDILAAVKELAASRKTTAGKVLSELARKALEPAETPTVRNGVRVLPRRPPGAAKPSMDLVNRLRDEP